MIRRRCTSRPGTPASCCFLPAARSPPGTALRGATSIACLLYLNTLTGRGRLRRPRRSASHFSEQQRRLHENAARAPRLASAHTVGCQRAAIRRGRWRSLPLRSRSSSDPHGGARGYAANARAPALRRRRSRRSSRRWPTARRATGWARARCWSVPGSGVLATFLDYAARPRAGRAARGTCSEFPIVLPAPRTSRCCAASCERPSARHLRREARQEGAARCRRASRNRDGARTHLLLL